METPVEPPVLRTALVHPTGEGFANARAYRKRLLARPSFARAVDEARQYARSSRAERRTATDPARARRDDSMLSYCGI
jgi:hypothetical protein